jgi:hypothetical protein
MGPPDLLRLLPLFPGTWKAVCWSLIHACAVIDVEKALGMIVSNLQLVLALKACTNMSMTGLSCYTYMRYT